MWSKSRREILPSSRERQELGIKMIVRKCTARLLADSLREKFFEENSKHAFKTSSVPINKQVMQFGHFDSVAFRHTIR